MVGEPLGIVRRMIAARSVHHEPHERGTHVEVQTEPESLLQGHTHVCSGEAGRLTFLLFCVLFRICFVFRNFRPGARQFVESYVTF